MRKRRLWLSTTLAKSLNFWSTEWLMLVFLTSKYPPESQTLSNMLRLRGYREKNSIVKGFTIARDAA